MSQQVLLPWTLLLLLLANAMADENKPLPELKPVVDKLQPLFKKLDPNATFEFMNEGRSAQIRYLPQTFKIHGISRTGEVAAEAHDEVGPSYKGVVLNINLQPKGEINQLVTPQTLRRPYWLTDLDVTPLANTDRQIYWGLSYGSRSSEEFLEQVRKTLTGMAE